MGLSGPVVEQIRELPNRPGIYLFRDGEGALLYVGKAKSLRKRVANYLRSSGEPRIDKMLREVAKLDFVLTDSESEALLLENNWIKSKRPQYNVLLRDDKTYPYVKLTMGDDYPRVALTRRIRRDGSEYFGPYLPGGLARKARDRRLAAPSLSLPRPESVSGTLRGGLDYRDGVLRGHPTGADVSRRQERPAGSGAQAGNANRFG
jgi:hypothetical protein